MGLGLQATKQVLDCHRTTWPLMFHALHTGQIEQIIQQMLHPLALRGHDTEKFLLGVRVICRRALQCFHKPHQRGQRCAEFVTGIGHKIRMLALGIVRFCFITQRDKHQRMLGAVRRDAQASGPRE
ncbi:hypothetical protein Amal_04106 [Acetobacter malorum]|uniref:Uncharacterized protein n=1 Tax=Acetobacter malorum TaxID=178901 RepID=A0A177FVE0_9PROT|nr:hypothetical protein Amal_04106 [Acetobacter malorum]